MPKVITIQPDETTGTFIGWRDHPDYLECVVLATNRADIEAVETDNSAAVSPSAPASLAAGG